METRLIFCTLMILLLASCQEGVMWKSDPNAEPDPNHYEPDALERFDEAVEADEESPDIDYTPAEPCRYQKDEVLTNGDIKRLTYDIVIGESVAGEGKLFASFIRRGAVKGLYLTYNQKLGCVNKSSFATLYFADETSINLNHIASENCEDIPTFIAGISNSWLEKVTTKNIVSIKYGLQNDFAEVTLYPQQQDFFRKGLYCLQ